MFLGLISMYNLKRGGRDDFFLNFYDNLYFHNKYSWWSFTLQQITHFIIFFFSEQINWTRGYFCLSSHYLDFTRIISLSTKPDGIFVRHYNTSSWNFHSNHTTSVNPSAPHRSLVIRPSHDRVLIPPCLNLHIVNTLDHKLDDFFFKWKDDDELKILISHPSTIQSSQTLVQQILEIDIKLYLIHDVLVAPRVLLHYTVKVSHTAKKKNVIKM